MFYEFKGLKPVVHRASFVHPHATVIGDVIIGRDVYIGSGAVIRGDFGRIIIEEGANVQENCIIHMFPGITVLLKESAHIGHGAIIHGATIGKNALIGMNAVVMDNVVVGDNSIVGALCFVPEGMVIPERKLVVGNPAKVIKDVTDEMIEWKTKGTAIYQALPKQCSDTLKECEPLSSIPPFRNESHIEYETWGKHKKYSTEE